MENRKNNQTTSFLMIVGIIFIVVAGTIFVSSTWGYLPDPVKFIILLAVGTGLQLGSQQLRRKGMLKKTEAAMFYLGTAFFAFASFMVCKNITVASIVALIPVSIRFGKERKAFDFVMTALLADWVVLWFQLQSDFGLVGICILSSIVLCIYTLLDVYRNKWQENKRSIETAFTVLYILHIVDYVIRSLVILLIGSILVESEVEYVFTLVVMAAVVVAIASIHYQDRRSEIVRIFQSFSIFWLVIISMVFVNHYLLNGVAAEVTVLMIFGICAGIMATLLRKEMFYIVLGTGLFIPIGEWFDHQGHYVYDQSTVVYSLLTFVFVGALAVYYYRKEQQWEPEIQLNQGVAAAITQFVVYMALMCSVNLSDDEFIGWFIIAMQCLTVNFLFENSVVKKVFQVLALVNAEFASWYLIDTYIDDDYAVVAACAAMAAAVYFGGIIIDAENKVVQWIQYAFACSIAMVMLLNALVAGNVEQAIIVGICGAITLVIAAVQNSKRYVILSSIVLVLLVFYLTRHIWASIAWWVYLFVAGVVLIALAVKKESAEHEVVEEMSQN